MIFISFFLSPHPPSHIKYVGSHDTRLKSLEIGLIIIKDKTGQKDKLRRPETCNS
jgi:hypothetical protein